MPGKDWFKTGEEGRKEAEKADEEAAKRRRDSQDENVIIKKRRLWMPPDTSLKATFLDNPGLGA